MTPLLQRLLPCAFAAVLLHPITAHAQLALHLTGEFGFASAYLDRGVIRTNQPVLQPSLAVSLPAGGGSATIGLWATVEPASYSGAQYFSMAPGEKSPNVTEFRPSLELAQPVGPVGFSFRATMQMFPNLSGLTKAANTFDLASTASLARAPLSPTVMVAYDLGAINGAYLEGRVRQALPLAKGAAIVLSAKGGYAIRQQVDSAPDAFASYQRNGFTHLDLTVGTRISAAGAEITPYLTYTRVPHPMESAAAPGRQRPEMLVFGTTVRVTGTLPKKK